MYIEKETDFNNNPIENKQYLKDFKSLNQEMKRRGLYQRDQLRMLLELIAHIFITLSGIILCVMIENIFFKGVGMVIMTLGLLGVGTHTHNSSHNASTNDNLYDDILTYLGYSFILGFSATFWKYKHCIVHHSNPNIVGVDEDIDLMPFFAVTEADTKNAGVLGQFYYSKIQQLIFPFVISLTAFNIQRQAWVFLLKALMDNKRRKMDHWLDLAFNLLHYAAWMIIPMLFYPVMDVLAFHIIKNVLVGYALFFMLGSSHLPAEAVCSAEDQKEADFVLKQTAATINIRTGRWGRFLMSGLDFQIEHHLLRGISYTKLPEVSELVKEYCQYHNYQHQTLGFWEASCKTIAVFYKPKQVLTVLSK